MKRQATPEDVINTLLLDKWRNRPIYTKELLEQFEEDLNKYMEKKEELGYIGKYRWGVEYPTNGKKPDLDEDILVKVDDDPSADAVENWEWCLIRSFRITDLRYKPSDTSYLVERGMELVNQIQEKLEYVTEKLEANSWWDYENGLPLSFPPAGTTCLVSSPDHASEWIETFIVGMGEDGACVFELMTYDRYDYAYDGWSVPELFRPLDYFTRKEVEAEKKKIVDAAMDFWNNSPYGPLTTFEKMYEAGYLVLPQKKEE